MSLNQAAYEALEEPKAVSLLYDRRARVIGIQPAGEEAAYAHRVHAQKGSSRTVYASSFLNAYGIPHDALMTFEDVRLEHGILLINLDRAQRQPRRLPALGFG
ncbi:MAG: hypothetical protein ACR2PL_03005, partial [Dehalococcoidia bacterium]